MGKSGLGVCSLIELITCLNLFVTYNVRRTSNIFSNKMPSRRSLYILESVDFAFSMTLKNTMYVIVLIAYRRH